MFPLLLKHPLHGAMYAYDTQELERLSKLGWQDASVVHVPLSEPEIVALAPKRAYRRKAA